MRQLAGAPDALRQQSAHASAGGGGTPERERPLADRTAPNDRLDQRDSRVAPVSEWGSEERSIRASMASALGASGHVIAAGRAAREVRTSAGCAPSIDVSYHGAGAGRQAPGAHLRRIPRCGGRGSVRVLLSVRGAAAIVRGGRDRRGRNQGCSGVKQRLRRVVAGCCVRWQGSAAEGSRSVDGVYSGSGGRAASISSWG
jgi:hypothetical protein